MADRKFISPGDACKLVEQVLNDITAAQAFLLTYAGAGEIYVRAEKTLEKGKQVVANKRITAAEIRDHSASIPASFWNQAIWELGQIQFAGISFDASQVDSVIEKFAANSGQNSPQRAPLKGGRATLQHGEAIAELTLRCFALSQFEFNRLTPDSMARELDIEYKKTGSSAPTSKNLLAISEGILRVLRRARSI